jgi:thiamine kinase-like enzyme
MTNKNKNITLTDLMLGRIKNVEKTLEELKKVAKVLKTIKYSRSSSPEQVLDNNGIVQIERAFAKSTHLMDKILRDSSNFDSLIE